MTRKEYLRPSLRGVISWPRFALSSQV
jgi:hypothetical protein